jgi:hypothetical protein
LERSGDLEQIGAYGCDAVVQQDAVPTAQRVGVDRILGYPPQHLGEGAALAGADQPHAPAPCPAVSPSADYAGTSRAIGLRDGRFGEAPGICARSCDHRGLLCDGPLRAASGLDRVGELAGAMVIRAGCGALAQR